MAEPMSDIWDDASPNEDPAMSFQYDEESHTNLNDYGDAEESDPARTEQMEDAEHEGGQELLETPTTHDHHHDRDNKDILTKEIEEDCFVEMMQQVKKRRCDDAMISWPVAVIVGDQNIGKSSLVSRLCGFKLPQEDGTCTRSPILLRIIRHQGEFCCRVAIDQHYIPGIEQGGHYPGYKSHKVARLEDRMAILGHTSEVEKVGELIERAHIANLNPSQNVSVFGSTSAAMVDFRGLANEMSFSPNVIRVDIAGPGVDTISVLDLPGLTMDSGASGSHHGLSAAVWEAMAIEHISRPDTLVIAAALASAEPNTSPAIRIVNQHCVESRRYTIWTKADSLLPHRLYKRMKEASPVPFVVSNRHDTEDTELTPGEEMEMIGRWCGTFPDLSTFVENMGVSVLKTKIQAGLGVLLKDEWEAICHNIMDERRHVEERLEMFPPQDPAKARDAFLGTVRHTGDVVASFMSSRNDALDQFAELLLADLRKGAPTLDLTTEAAGVGDKRKAQDQSGSGKRQRLERGASASSGEHPPPHHSFTLSEIEDGLRDAGGSNDSMPPYVAARQLFASAIRYWDQAVECYTKSYASEIRNGSKNVVLEACPVLYRSRPIRLLMREIDDFVRELERALAKLGTMIVGAQCAVPDLDRGPVDATTRARVDQNLHSTTSAMTPDASAGDTKGKPRKKTLKREYKAFVEVMRLIQVRYEVAAVRLVESLAGQYYEKCKHRTTAKLQARLDAFGKAIADNDLTSLDVGVAHERERLDERLRGLKWIWHQVSLYR